MPPRPTLPVDDLYARLGVPRTPARRPSRSPGEASSVNITPMSRDPTALEAAKRINVAHDWLSDPDLRRRYDRERATGSVGGRPPRAGPDWATAPVRPFVRRPPTIAERVAAVIERVGSPDASTSSIAWPSPSLRRSRSWRPCAGSSSPTWSGGSRPRNATPSPSCPPRPGATGPDPRRRRRPLADVILGDVLDELLGDPAAMRARERLTRGWDAASASPATGPPRWPSATLVERARGLTADELRRLATTGTVERLGDAPWPPATSPDEDEALRVSSELAWRCRGCGRRGRGRGGWHRCPHRGRGAARGDPRRPPARAPPRLPTARVRAARGALARHAHRADRAMEPACA